MKTLVQQNAAFPKPCKVEIKSCGKLLKIFIWEL